MIITTFCIGSAMLLQVNCVILDQSNRRYQLSLSLKNDNVIEIIMATLFGLSETGLTCICNKRSALIAMEICQCLQGKSEQLYSYIIRCLLLKY